MLTGLRELYTLNSSVEYAFFQSPMAVIVAGEAVPFTVCNGDVSEPHTPV